jgi:hypothetical protein
VNTLQVDLLGRVFDERPHTTRLHGRASDERRLTAVEVQHLAAVPAAVEWFANINNPRTRRAYQNDPNLRSARTTSRRLSKVQGQLLSWPRQPVSKLGLFWFEI